MRVSRVLGMALITLRVTETVKEALPIIPPAPVKSTFTIALAVGLSAAHGERNFGRMVLEGAAAAGAASVLHDVQESMRRFTDNQIAGVITRARRATPLGA